MMRGLVYVGAAFGAGGWMFVAVNTPGSGAIACVICAILSACLPSMVEADGT